MLRKFVDQYRLNDWHKYLGKLERAQNSKSHSITHLTADRLTFGKDRLTIVDQLAPSTKAKRTPQQRADALIQQLSKLWLESNSTLTEHRKKYNPKPLKTYSEDLAVGKFVWLHRPKTSMEHALSKKLVTPTLGPFEISKIDHERGEVELILAKGHTHKVKTPEVRPVRFDYKPKPGELKASKVSELIWIKDPPLPPTKPEREYELTEKELSLVNLKNLVGHRVIVYWPTKGVAGWWKGTVVGYDASMKNALVFYDIRTDDIPRETDYFTCDLLNSNKRYRTSWKILHPT